MTVVRLEAEQSFKTSRCENCGGTTALIHGFIYGDEEPHGVYFVEWCEGAHDGRAAFLTVSLGKYGTDAVAADERVAFCIEMRCDGMRLSDEPCRNRPDVLGRFVPRDEALQWPDISHLWHVADHVATDDQRVISIAAWLCGDRTSALC
jgi:hypothetical protein